LQNHELKKYDDQKNGQEIVKAPNQRFKKSFWHYQTGTLEYYRSQETNISKITGEVPKGRTRDERLCANANGQKRRAGNSGPPLKEFAYGFLKGLVAGNGVEWRKVDGEPDPAYIPKGPSRHTLSLETTKELLGFGAIHKQKWQPHVGA